MTAFNPDQERREPTTPAGPPAGATPPATDPVPHHPTAPPSTPRSRGAVPGAGSKRPTGVAILTALLGAWALIALLGGMVFLGGGAALGDEGGNELATLGVGYVILGVASAAVGYGVWTRQRWAWYGAFVVAVLGVFVSIAGLVSGQVVANVLGLIVTAAIVWFLLTREVQDWFGVHAPTPGGRGRPA